MSSTTENTVKAVAESFIQNAKAREFTICVQNLLINDGNAVEDDVLKKASLVLRPIDYDAVIEDRVSRKRCGFPKCDKQLPEVNPNTKYLFSVKDAVMVDVSEGYVFCSQDCAAKSAAFKVKLSEEPLMMRNFVKFRRTSEANDEKQPDPEIKVDDTSRDLHTTSHGHSRSQNSENAIRASMGLPLIPDPQDEVKDSEDGSRTSEPPVVVMSSTMRPDKSRRPSKSVAFAETLEQPATPSSSEGGAKPPTSILVKSNKSEQSRPATLDAKPSSDSGPSERKTTENKQNGPKDTFKVSNLFVVERKRPSRNLKTSSAEAAPSVIPPISDQPAVLSTQNGEAESNGNSATPEPSSQVKAPPTAPKQKLPMHIVRAKAREAAAASADKSAPESTTATRRDAAAHLNLVLSRTEEAEKLRDRMKVPGATGTPSPNFPEITEEMKKTMTPAQLNTLKFKQSLAAYEMRTKEQLAEEEAIAQRIAQRQEEARKARAEMARKLSEMQEGVEAINATHKVQQDSTSGHKPESIQPSPTPDDEKAPSDLDKHSESRSESDEDSENPNETDLIDDEGDDDPDTTRAIEQAASFERMERKAQRTARRLALKGEVSQEAPTAEVQPHLSQQDSQTENQDEDDMSDLAQAIMGMLSGEAQLLSYLTSCVTDATYRALSRKAGRTTHEVDATTDPEALDIVPASEFELGQSLTLEAAEQRRSRLQSLRALIQPYFSLACTGLHTRMSTASLSRRLINLLQTLRLPQAIPHVTGSYWKSLAVACLLAFAYQDGMDVPSRCSAQTASKCPWLDHPSSEVWNTFLSQHSTEYDSIYAYYVILTTGVDDDD